MKLSGNKIFITGGASGIGLGLTERFLQEGNTVIICGRREEALQEAKEKFTNIITKVCDLNIESDRINLYNWISENHSDLNVLVNNAGIQNWMEVSDADFYEKAKTEISTNVFAPVHLTSLFVNLKSLNTIINVTSGLAFVQLTKVPIYCATKAFFHSFTIAMQHLLKEKNIEVIEMVPPALNTDLGGVGLHDEQPPVSTFVDSVFEQMKAEKKQLTFGFSEVMANATPEIIAETFKRMNP
jgi:uncharacterized oxidoreductase